MKEGDIVYLEKEKSYFIVKKIENKEFVSVYCFAIEEEEKQNSFNFLNQHQNYYLPWFEREGKIL